MQRVNIVINQLESNSLEAIAAYINVIKRKGANSTSVHERSEFLTRLNQHLDALPKTNGSFRVALKKVLDESNRNEWTFYLTVSREYLPFWSNDIKKVASLSHGNGFNLDLPRQATRSIHLDELRDQVASASFSVAEKWGLNNYKGYLRQNLVDAELMEVKLIMAKMIVFEIRSLELPPVGAYKMAVDLIMPCFESDNARNMFADVSSDFFTFYDGRTRN